MKLQRNLWSILALLLFTSSSIFSQTTYEKGKMIVKAQKKSTKSISIQLANLEKRRIEVSITDLNGKPWFSEYVWGKNGYAKQLNLEKIPNGTYLLVIKNKLGTYIQTLAKQAENIEFYRTMEVKNTGFTRLVAHTHKATVASISAINKEALAVQIANLNKEEAYIQLNNIDGVNLVKERIFNQKDYAKKINLKGLPTGKYYFSIQSKQLQMIQMVVIRKEGIILGSQQILEGINNKSDLVLR